MRTHAPRRGGNVAVVVAVCLTAILGAAALSLDGGLLVDKRRQVQGAADAAALAAAGDLYYNWWTATIKGLDNTQTVTVTGCVPSTTTGSAKAAARAAAAANGYVDGVNGCSVTVNIPPLSGPFTGLSGHVEVLISTTQARYFSRLWATDAIPYGARAVARGRRGGINNAIITLDPSGKGALNAGGNGVVKVTGSPIQVNSNNYSAMIANGGGTLQADSFDVVGSPGSTTPGGGTFIGPINPSSPVMPDPLADLPVPDTSTLTVQSDKKMQISGNNTENLNPGIYVGGINITGKGNVNLAPGVYYMQGGGFSWSGQGNLVGSGVLIYNAPTSKSDTIDLSGQGTATLSPPTSGAYQGITIFQDRTSTTPMSISGNGKMTVTGTVYAASANLSVTGNGTIDLIGAQYISYDLVLGGNGNFNLTWNANITPGKREILLVE